MSEQSDRFRIPKLDQSPFLFHFIKGTELHAESVLKKILSEKRLITQTRQYLCFTATPVTHLGAFFDTKTRDKNQPIYQPYGIGFNRDKLIKEFGVKNVIYGDDKDYSDLHSINLTWRYERLNTQYYDYEWLREWRMHSVNFDFSGLDFEDIVVITPTTKKLLDIVSEHTETGITYHDDELGCDEYDVIDIYDRKWRGISLEKINTLQLVSDYQLLKTISKQRQNEDMWEESAEVNQKELDKFNRSIYEANKWLFQDLTTNNN